VCLVRGEGRRKRCLVVDCEVLAYKYICSIKFHCLSGHELKIRF
jgi:hypothetical protein